MSRSPPRRLLQKDYVSRRAHQNKEGSGHGHTCADIVLDVDVVRADAGNPQPASYPPGSNLRPSQALGQNRWEESAARRQLKGGVGRGQIVADQNAVNLDQLGAEAPTQNLVGGHQLWRNWTAIPGGSKYRISDDWGAIVGLNESGQVDQVARDDGSSLTCLRADSARRVPNA